MFRVTNLLTVIGALPSKGISRTIRSVVIGCCLLAAPLTTNAAWWAFEGEVTLLIGGADTDVAVGDHFSGDLRFVADTELGPIQELTKTLLDSWGIARHPFMNEVSRWTEAERFGGPAILNVSATIETAGGPVVFESARGSDVYHLLRHQENEWKPLSDAPPSEPFDSFFTAALGPSIDIGTRLISKTSPSGLFPLDGLLDIPPDLADLHLGRFWVTFDSSGDGFVDSQIFGTFDQLVQVNVTLVTTDIKPGSDPNSINPGAGGFLGVAILTSSIADGDPLDFDATQVNPTSVRFGPNFTVLARAAKANDVDHDGDADLILHFKIADTGIECGDFVATLTGRTFNGDAIEGTDSLVTRCR